MRMQSVGARICRSIAWHVAYDQCDAILPVSQDSVLPGMGIAHRVDPGILQPIGFSEREVRGECGNGSLYFYHYRVA